jgi:hypothetical protein
VRHGLLVVLVRPADVNGRRQSACASRTGWMTEPRASPSVRGLRLRAWSSLRRQSPGWRPVSLTSFLTTSPTSAGVSGAVQACARQKKTGRFLRGRRPVSLAFRSAPQRIRTSDLRLRRPSLYPAELVAQTFVILSTCRAHLPRHAPGIKPHCYSKSLHGGRKIGAARMRRRPPLPASTPGHRVG